MRFHPPDLSHHQSLRGRERGEKGEDRLGLGLEKFGRVPEGRLDEAQVGGRIRIGGRQGHPQGIEARAPPLQK